MTIISSIIFARDYAGFELPAYRAELLSREPRLGLHRVGPLAYLSRVFLKPAWMVEPPGWLAPGSSLRQSRGWRGPADHSSSDPRRQA